MLNKQRPKFRTKEESKLTISEIIKLLQFGAFKLQKTVAENPKLLCDIESNRTSHTTDKLEI